MASEVAWQRLHPASVGVNLLPRTWSLVRSLWPVLLFALYGQSQGDGVALVDASILVVFFALAAWNTVLHWLTLRYRVHEGRLEVRSGLVYRQNRVIAPERIQNIEMVRNLFHRMANLVEIRIETASGTEVEGLLSALTVAQGAELIDQLGKATGTVDPETEEVVPPLVSNSFADLLRYGATTGRLGAMALAVGVGVEWLQFSDPEEIRDVGLVLGALGGIALIIAVGSGAFVLGVGNAVVRHYGFRLTRLEDSMVAEEGLFTLRRVELPLSKVQLVTISEPLIRRVLGFGSIHIETAAARVEQGGVQQSEAMAPVVGSGEVQRVVQASLPQLDVPLDQISYQPPHPKALIRALLVSTVRNVVFCSILIGLLGWWGALGILLIPLGWTTAWLDHRYQGWHVTDQVVIARRGWWSRRTQILDRRKLQSMRLSQGPFLRNWGLAVLRVRVAGSSVVLPVLSWDEATRIELDLLHAPGEA